MHCLHGTLTMIAPRTLQTWFHFIRTYYEYTIGYIFRLHQLQLKTILVEYETLLVARQQAASAVLVPAWLRDAGPAG